MKRWTAMVVGSLQPAGFCAARRCAEGDADRHRHLQMKAPYFIAMVRALEAEGRAHNVRTFVADGNGDVAKVNSDIEDLLAKGVDGLIMNISRSKRCPAAWPRSRRPASRSCW